MLYRYKPLYSKKRYILQTICINISRVLKNGPKNRIFVVIGIIVGVLLAVGLFYGGMYLLDPVLDDYLHNKPITRLYDFYDLKVGENETAVYFIGDSAVGSAVYIPQIMAELEANGYPNIAAYNLYRASDDPVRRLSQIENIIESQPSLVIYGIRSWNLKGDTSWVDEDVILVNDRLLLDSDAEHIYTDEQLEDIYSDYNPFYMKIFLKGAILALFSGSTEDVSPTTHLTENAWDAWTTPEKRDKYDSLYAGKIQENVEITDTYANITDRNIYSLSPFSAEKTQKQLAFEFMLERLKEEGIPVILVVMPQHPILSELTSDESRRNFHNYLNSTGLVWYDMEQMYGDEHFSDLAHTTWNGTIDFAPIMANIIIQEVESGAIHYT